MTRYYEISLTFKYNNYSSTHDFIYPIEESLQDIIEYYFEQKYHKKYQELAWIVEDEVLEFVKDIENKWIQNKIDLFDLYVNNRDFKEFIQNKHLEEFVKSIEHKFIQEFEEKKEQSIDEDDYEIFIDRYYN